MSPGGVKNCLENEGNEQVSENDRLQVLYPYRSLSRKYRPHLDLATVGDPEIGHVLTVVSMPCCTSGQLRQKAV
jgi:hypothetical protein